MKHFLGPFGITACSVALGLLFWTGPPAASAQARGLVQLLDDPVPLLAHSKSQGYLGVDVADVNSEKTQALKLKDGHGALITLIDHDAPAGQAGLRVNDVVLSMNGQAVEGADRLRRMLREIPPGGKVILVISRDGSQQTLAITLVDRKAMEQDLRNRIAAQSDNPPPPPGHSSFSILSGGSNAESSAPGRFHMPGFGSGLNVGALVEPLTAQMAEYLGVSNGLMIKQVARKSEADVAGLKVHDVVLKIGSEPIHTSADWDRVLRLYQGKPVPVTILRDKKQQTLTLQVDSKRGAVEWKGTTPGGLSAIAKVDPGSVLPSSALQPEELR